MITQYHNCTNNTQIKCTMPIVSLPQTKLLSLEYPLHNTEVVFIPSLRVADVLRSTGNGPNNGLDIGVSNCSSTSSPTEHINTTTTTSKLGVHVVHGISGLSNSSSTNTTNGTSGISSSGNLIHSTTTGSSSNRVLSSSPFGNHLLGHGHSIKSTNSTRSSNSVHHHEISSRGGGGGGVGGIVIPNEVSGGGCGSTGSVIGTVTTTTTSGGSNGDATPSESSFKCSNRSVPLLGRRAVSRRKVNLSEIEDLIHLDGPLTEDAVIRCLQARSSSGKYSVSECILINSSSIIYHLILSLTS